MSYTLPQNQHISNPSSDASSQRSTQNDSGGRESDSPLLSIFSIPEGLLSESANGISEILRSFQRTTEDTRLRLYVEEPDELVPDYIYIERACALAAKAPGMVLSEEQSKTFIGLRDISYSIDEDY